MGAAVCSSCLQPGRAPGGCAHGLSHCGLEWLVRPGDPVGFPSASVTWTEPSASLVFRSDIRLQNAKTAAGLDLRRFCALVIVYEGFVYVSVLCRPGGDLLFRVLRRSTIGAGAIYGRVRDGIGYGRPAVATRPAKDRGFIEHMLVFRRPSIFDGQ